MRIVVRKNGKVFSQRDFKEEVVYFGRSRKNEVVLSDSSVSRRHAKLFRTGSTYYVEDLKTVNGTRLKGEKIARVEIAVGDQFEIGPFLVSIEDALLPSEEATMFDEGAGTTFAEAETDLAKGNVVNDNSESFLSATPLPTSLEPPENLKVLQNFLKEESSAADLLPVQKTARLVRLDGPDTGKSIQVKEQETTFGRALDNDVVVPEAEVSESHAVIEKNDSGTFILKNRHPSVGTYVDGVPIKERELENHDIVQVGKSRFEFVEGASRSKAEPPRVLIRGMSEEESVWIRTILSKLTSWKVLPLYGVVIAFFYLWVTSIPTPENQSRPSQPQPSAVPTEIDEENQKVIRFLLEKAKTALDQKDFPETEDKLRQILTRLDPNNAEALALLQKLRDAKAAPIPTPVENKKRTLKLKELPPKKSAKSDKSVKSKKGTAKLPGKDFKKTYQEGVVKYESGDYRGASVLLKEVAAAKGSQYQSSAQNILNDIRKNSSSQIKSKLSSIESTFESDPLQAYKDLKPLADQFPDDDEVKKLKNKIESDLETKAKKAFSEGIAFQDVVEDIPSALERYQEALKFAPDPKMKYHIKAQKKIKELEASPSQ